tara:strand:- start:65 stop:2263 length:2199 start_codon:yes stop_codon:yes gene_type:complete
MRVNWFHSLENRPMTRQPTTTLRPGWFAVLLATALLIALAGDARLHAATAHDFYTAALSQERELRAPTDEPATLEQWREAIADYQEIVRLYPRSGYSDNALWQAAGLATQAFDRYRQPLDKDTGVTLLAMLEREYPSSSLVPRIVERLEQLRRLDRPVRLRAIHREPLDDLVRVTIELDDEVRYETERLEGPARLFFDLSGTYALPPLRQATLAFDDGDLVAEIRVGTHPEQTTRVVLDIEDVEQYSVYTLYNPYRLVVDTVSTASMQARRATSDRFEQPLPLAGHTGSAPIDHTDFPVPLEMTANPAQASPPPADMLPRVPPELSTATRLPIPEGWTARRLDPIPPPPLSDANAALDDEPGEVEPHDNPRLHEVLHPGLGSPPRRPAAVGPLVVKERDPVDRLDSATWRPVPDVATPDGYAVPISMVDLAPLPTVDWTVQSASLLPDRDATPMPDGKLALTVADSALESFGNAEAPVGAKSPYANSTGDFSLGRQLGLGVSRIVIDPGHGGYDPGAQTGALAESALVLDVAHRLETRLQQETGIEVILTRRGDDYIPLRGRTELANRVGADLFLSIHANAAADRSAGGVETYYLDLATEPAGRTVAARENAAALEGMHDLPRLVQSITMRNKLDESRDFAEIVQRNLLLGVRQLNPSALDLGVKQAPFVVLIGANMPSVLAEIAFLTNDEDAAFLATDSYRDRIADSLLQSILEYQQTLKPSASFAADDND